MSLTRMHSHGKRVARARRVALLGGILSTLAVPAVASANASNIESGRAYDFAISALGMNLKGGPDTGLISTTQASFTKLNAGSLSSPFGSGSLLSASVETAKAIHAHGVIPNESATSTATIAHAHLTLPGLPVVDGTLLGARSSASAATTGPCWEAA